MRVKFNAFSVAAWFRNKQKGDDSTWDEKSERAYSEKSSQVFVLVFLAFDSLNVIFLQARRRKRRSAKLFSSACQVKHSRLEADQWPS